MARQIAPKLLLLQFADGIKLTSERAAADMQGTLVCQALQLAIAQRQLAAGLIVHSDRGSQYASGAYRALLARHGLVGSMSRKGNCWDTQYKISLSTAFDLTRVGIGIMPLS